MKKTLLRYGISLAVGAAFSVLYLVLNNFSTMMEPVEQYKLLSNAFTISGLLLLGLGALVWVSTTGFFDGIAYALKHVGGLLIPGFFNREKKYGDYKAEMADKRKAEKPPVLHLLLTGALFMVLTAIFMILFYSVYKA